MDLKAVNNKFTNSYFKAQDKFHEKKEKRL